MNLELVEKIEKILAGLEARDKELRVQFRNASRNSERNILKGEIEKVDQTYYEVLADKEMYVELVNQNTLGEVSDTKLLEVEEKLAKEYGVTIYKVADPEELEAEEDKPVEVVKVKKSSGKLKTAIVSFLAGALVVTGAGYLLKGCNGCNKDDVRTQVAIEETVNTPKPTPVPTPVATATPAPTPTATPAPTATPTPTPEPTPEVVEEKPFEEYGNYTDVNDEAQLRRRAEWYYKTYITDPAKSKAGANMFKPEVLMNDMRMIGGEFMVNGNGEVTYNDTDMIAVANDLHSIANFDSFKQYGTQIFFTPMAPLFPDGSLAQKAAVQLDEAMEKVVAAIRANDDEAFLEAAREWGIIVINQFNYVDFTGEYVNINQVDTPTSFALYHAMSAKYASTILEYSEGHRLNVCIPYCYDGESGELTEKPLSEIMYQINEIPMDAVAERSGHKEEYEANNLSLPERLFVLAKNYFISKYDLEHGCSKTLK